MNTTEHHPAPLDPRLARKKSMFVLEDGRNVLFVFSLLVLLFALWGFCNGMIDVMDKHFQEWRSSLRKTRRDKEPAPNNSGSRTRLSRSWSSSSPSFFSLPAFPTSRWRTITTSTMQLQTSRIPSGRIHILRWRWRRNFF